VQQYLHKGSKVYIEGAIRTNEWVDNDGQKKWSTKIYGAELKMLDSKPAQPAAPYPVPGTTQAPNDYTPQPTYGNDFDSDVGF
ncbi:MAG: single-stranded DNA-binding protein, partial [Thiomargarita sp.]|nr:single-stranded DNA-binding protein [Thiomargarita sp.]